MPMGLTKRQADCLAFIERYTREHYGVSPTFREIGEAIGVSSTSAVSKTVHRLRDRGYIRKLPGRARAIEVLRRDRSTTPPAYTLDELGAYFIPVSELPRG